MVESNSIDIGESTVETGNNRSAGTSSDVGLPVCHVYRSFSELPIDQAEWDDFIIRNGCNFFSTYDWCRIWWNHYGTKRELRIYIVRVGDVLAGIFPLFSEKIWLFPVFLHALKFIGSDHAITHFFLPVRRDLMEEVTGALFREIREGKNDIIWFGPMSGLSVDWDMVGKSIAGAFKDSYHTRIRDAGEQIYYHLADSWENQLLRISRSDVKDLERSTRRLLKMYGSGNDEIKREYSDSRSLQEDFTGFVDMHRMNWKKQGMLGHFGDWPGSIKFHRELAFDQLPKGRLKLLKISIGGKVLGYFYDYVLGNTSLEILAGRSEDKDLSKISIGKINHSEKMKLHIQDKVTLLDSMRGKYDYKVKFGGTAYMTKSILLFSNHPWNGIRIWLFRKSARLLHLLYYRLWFCRFAVYYPFTRKPLSEKWIKTTFMGGLK